MPEPGIDDVDFDRPTTGRKRPRQRRRALLKLPVEFAEFRLSDGRPLGAVLGEEFFGPASGAGGGRPISKSVRELLREGNSPLSGIIRDDPRIAPRPETAGGIFHRDRAEYRQAPVATAGVGKPLGPTEEGNPVTDPGLPTHPLGHVQRQRNRQHAEQALKDLEEDREEKGKARAEAQKRLPGVGTPTSLLEAYDRADAGETFGQMGLDPAFFPDGSTPVDEFVAKVEEYADSSSGDRARLRNSVPFDKTLEELLRTQDNFQNYLDVLDKRADVHNDSFDKDVRKGQAAVNARKRNFRAALEREKGKLFPDVAGPTNEPVDAAAMYSKLGFDPDESRLSGYVSLVGNLFAARLAKRIEDDAVETANRLAREGHFRWGKSEWDVFRHGYASIRATMELGPWTAKRIGEVNELRRPDNPTGESLMDIYNNNVGRKLAIDALTQARSLDDVVLDSVRRGDYPALGGGRRDWPVEDMVLQAIRDGEFQMQSFRLKQSATPD